MKQSREKSKQSVETPERWKAGKPEPEAAGQQHSLLHLQRLAGNRAVVNLLGSHGQVQTKLRTSEPGDEHEQEADRAAAQVMTFAPAPNVLVQRKCADCSPGAKCAGCADEDERIQRKTKSPSVLSATVPRLQRAARNGESTPDATPQANAEPDAAANAGGLIVEDEAASVAPGQMRKSEFLEQLRSTVCTTADEALAEAGQSTAGCPYIEQWLSYYNDQPPAHIERALRKYAPEAAGAVTAHDYIPAVSNRVRQAVQNWARTGELTGVPEELQSMLSGPGAALGA
ncbi:MAG TPA: hypothetical protein VGN90_15000, partial [Pyrinomonadaceae bacterium]|nr:hypothetical protein [Pyrinomonadaceae bacterium]